MAKATSKTKTAKTRKAVGKTTVPASAGKTTTSTSPDRAQPKAPATRRRAGSAAKTRPSAGAAPAPARQTKTALLREMLAAKDGATVADLQAATGWQAHTVRAALSGLRKAGLTIERARDDDGTSRYRIDGYGTAGISS